MRQHAGRRESLHDITPRPVRAGTFERSRPSRHASACGQTRKPSRHHSPSSQGGDFRTIIVAPTLDRAAMRQHAGRRESLRDTTPPSSQARDFRTILVAPTLDRAAMRQHAGRRESLHDTTPRPVRAGTVRCLPDAQRIAQELVPNPDREGGDVRYFEPAGENPRRTMTPQLVFFPRIPSHKPCARHTVSTCRNPKFSSTADAKSVSVLLQ
jgi:hypothetical protein